MARRPFFGQGPGPLIARMDMNAATAVGREYGKAFREIGQAAGIAANSFIERQNQKKQVESSTRGFMAMGFPADVAKAMAKDPGVQDAMMKKKQLDQQMAIAKMQDATSRNNAEAPLIQKQEHWEAQQLEKQKNELADNQFISKIMGPSSVPTGQLNEAGQDELERGSLFIAPTEEARSDFRDALLKDPSTQTKVPMMDLSDNQFIQQFSEDSPEVQRRAFNLMQAMAEQKTGLTPSEVLAREKFEYEKGKDQKLEDEKNKPKPPVYQERTLLAIDDALKILNDDSFRLPVAGLFATTASEIGGTDAANLRQAITTIESSIGFDRLQKMREDSPTGGALGQVSERELALLNASLGSLSQMQSVEQLRTNLERVRTHYDNFIKSINARNQGLSADNLDSGYKMLNIGSPAIDEADLDRQIQEKQKQLQMRNTLDNPNMPNYGNQI